MQKNSLKLKEILEYLYNPGTKRYEAGRLIIFEGVDDADTLSRRTGVAKRTVYNIKGDIRRVATDMMRISWVKVPGDSGGRDQRDQGDGRDQRDPNVNTENKPPIGKGTQSLESLASRTHDTTARPPHTNTRTPEESRTPSPENNSRGKIVMHKYTFADGRVMYYSTRLGDIEKLAPFTFEKATSLLHPQPRHYPYP